VAAGEVSSDEVEEFVIVEQAIKLLELGLEAEAELGDHREEIGPFIAVS
jgi:hypothetical protein